MEPTFFEVLFRCILMPIMAITIISIFFFGILAFLDILSGEDPTKESLSMFFQEGAIFGPPKDNK